MTLGTTPPVTDYVEDGVTLIHAIPFQFRSAGDIHCSRIAAGVETMLTQGADFTVAGGGGGTGTVTKLSAGVAPTIFRIKRVTPRAQTTDYTPGDAFPAETHEAALDHAAAVDQEQDAQIADTAARAIRVPVGELGGLLPSGAARANKFFGFDGTGQPIATAGTLITITTPTVSPEVFASAKPSGIVGDGSDDGPAFAAMSAYINAAGGGVIELVQGRTYFVGSSSLHIPSVDQFGVPGGSYRFYPNTPYPIDINGCTKPVVLRLNGAVIRCLAGAKYGTFDPDGTPMASVLGYSGDGIGIPYFHMIRVKGCSGRVRIEGAGELDGNIRNALIGGFWGPGFDGRQIPMSGLLLQDNSGEVIVDGPIWVHHQGLDGMIGDGLGLLNTREKVTINGLTCTSNGRQGLSMVGGNGWVFNNYKGEKTGKDIAAMAYSQPGAGVDFEAEGGKYVCNIQFNDPICEDNAGAGCIADSSANTFDIQINNPRFVGTTNYGLWANRPGMKLIGGVCAGEIVHLFPDPDPTKAFYAYRTKFTMDPSYSPTGALYGNLMDISSQDITNVTFEECEFEKIGNAEVGTGQVPAATPVGPYYINCSCHAPNAAGGHFNVYGLFRGPRTTLVNVQAFPGPPGDTPWGGTNNLGIAEDAFTWSYPSTVAALGPPASVATRYRATFDRASQKRLYYGSVAYNPPSLAAGAKDAIQTFAMAGVAVGDIVVEQSFSAALAGTLIKVEPGAGLINYYSVNENGANPNDPPAGTLSVKVRKA